MRCVVLVVLLVTGLFALVNPVGSVAAQSSSPTIGQIQANPNAFIDQIVTISGRSGIYVGEDEFMLDDSTGQIVVDTPSSSQLTIPVGTSITVVGQIDWIGSPSAPRGVDLDACRITLPDRTIEIRDCSFGSAVPANPTPSQSPLANQSNSPAIGQIQANSNAFLYHARIDAPRCPSGDTTTPHPAADGARRREWSTRCAQSVARCTGVW